MTKNLLTLCVVALCHFYGTSQISTPAASPSSKIEQKVGLSTINVEYSRPSMKGRTIFSADGVVPFGKLWRAGANSATKISFSDDVTVSGTTLKKGDYAILIKPEQAAWDVNFYAYEGSNWSAYEEKTPAATVNAMTNAKPWTTETFSISFTDLKSNMAKLTFDWDRTSVTVPIALEVDKVVMANIEKVMAGPSTGDYYNAASYYHDSGKDLNKALEWIQMANKGDNPKFWQVRKEALILADLGRKKEAIEAAKKSRELAVIAENDEYVKMNDASIAEWSKK